MALLHDILSDLVDHTIPVSSVLLKLRLLAARLDVDVLEDWVRLECNGYPSDDVPEYRQASVSYTGLFSDGMRQLNTSVPAAIIESCASKKWTKLSLRESIPVIDSMVERKAKDRTFGLDVSNLKLLLSGKVYEDFECLELTGTINDNALVRVQSTVRSMTLDLALGIEEKAPAAAKIDISKPVTGVGLAERTQIAQLTQITVHGDLNQIGNQGSGTTISVNIAKGDATGLRQTLEKSGLPASDAKELAEVIASEQPDPHGKAIGSRTKKWIDKAASESWGVGKAVLTEVAKAVAKHYWGL